MRRSYAYILAAIVVVLLGVTGVLFQKYRTTSANYVEVQTAKESSDARYTEAINAIAEIQDSLSSVAVGDSGVRLLNDQLRTEQRLTQTQGHEALDRIAVLKAGIQRTKTRIAELEDRLHKSGVKVEGLQRMIANLKKTVEEREAMAAELTTRVDSLQTQVTGLVAEVQMNQDTIRARDQTLEERRRELGTIFYIIGSKRDLRNAGVVEAKGGVLGMGKTLKPSGNFNETLFTPMDTDAQTVVQIPSEKVQILSAQPTASYQLLVNSGQTELRILDPREFRKVKHLVIMTRG
jgi:hypothetical protein